MKKSIFNYQLSIINLFLLLLATAQGAVSQTVYEMVNHDTLWVYNCRDNYIEIQYPAYPYSVITESLDAYIVLETNGVPFNFALSMSQSGTSQLATLKLWDGDSASGTYIGGFTSGYPYQQYNVSSGRLTAHLHRADTSEMLLSLKIIWGNNTSFTSTCTSLLDSIYVTNLSHNAALLHWNDPSGAAKVILGNVEYTATGHEFYLQNLEPDSVYTVSVLPQSDFARPCCAKSISFRTGCIPYVGIPNFTDLQSESVRGYYGNTSDPYSNVGIIDFGSDQYASRHTVHTDTNETDIRTESPEGGLHTVCPGTRASVRLGNWATSSEAEALEYFLYIDTNIYAFLLLHYAVVLQNPSDHSITEQPRFRMEVLDNDGNIIDPVCGVADFSASASLGWNEIQDGALLWKDWTTMGFDMTSYHGQVVRVRFTTYDCSKGAHCGYAYFNATCRLNSATTEYCGETEINSITAPDGFNYLWYYNDPSNPVSTDQTVYFSNSDELLHCRLISKENPSCYVTLNTYAGHRWPLAIIDTLQTLPPDCDGSKVYFINRSVVINDDGDTVDWHCENARWYFGDSFTSQEYTPQHSYHDSGDYTVILVSGIANNSCRDTGYFTLHIPDYYIPAVKDTFACDTFWIDDIPYADDGWGPSYRVHHPFDCDTLYTLDLHVLHSPVFEMPPDTFCYRDTYSWHGMTAGDPHITDSTWYRLVDHLLASNGCDSLLVLSLLQLPPDRISIVNQADCSNKKYHITAVTDLPYLHWSSEPYDASFDGHETDASLIVVPDVVTVYTVTTDHRDTIYCPTSVAISLSPAEFPEAEIKVSSQILTLDHPEIDAYDVSRSYNTRWWGIQTFPGNGDTLRLSETSAHLHYRLDDRAFAGNNINIDSIMLILAVSNDACFDTTHRTIPFVNVAIWAPNAFVPSEGENSRFAPVMSDILEAELFVYDRTGRLIFNTSDLLQGWDGTRNGTPCPQGAYVWLLRYRAADYPDTWQTTSGTVTLIR